MDRVDDHVRPESAAVLAHAPAFGFVFAGVCCRYKCLFRNPVVSILLSIETREVLADDFLSGVALYSLRALVPIDDVSVGVKHENGIIDNRID